jgi:hypothetical protein
MLKGVYAISDPDHVLFHGLLVSRWLMNVSIGSDGNLDDGRQGVALDVVYSGRGVHVAICRCIVVLETDMFFRGQMVIDEWVARSLDLWRLDSSLKDWRYGAGGEFDERGYVDGGPSRSSNEAN